MMKVETSVLQDLILIVKKEDITILLKKLKEQIQQLNLIQRDYIIPIEVSKNGQGLVVEQGQMIQLNEDDVKNVDEIEFDNVYHCHGSVDITGKKELLDNDEIQVLDGGEFKFNIERVKNENGDAYTGNSVEKISRKQVSNDENGNFTFNITYQNLDFTVKDQYTFYYKITEENSGRVIKGITYNADKREYIVKVIVTDNGNGTYTVVKSLVNGGEINFKKYSQCKW